MKRKKVSDARRDLQDHYIIIVRDGKEVNTIKGQEEETECDGR
jgi:hypothetical protein